MPALWRRPRPCPENVAMDQVGALWEHPRGMAGLEEEQLLDALVADPNASAADLAKRFGVTPATTCVP